jgi:hypothetical protein
VAVTGSHYRTVRAEGHGKDLGTAGGRKNMSLLAGAFRPQIGKAICVTGGQRSSVRADGYRVDMLIAATGVGEGTEDG